MMAKQVKSINLLDLEDAVASKFNTYTRIKTVWQNAMILTNGYFSPMATLCFVLGVGAKKSAQISRTEIDKILESWQYDFNISPIEAIFLSSYSKFLKKIPFEIPKPNTSAPFSLQPRNSVCPIKKQKRKKATNTKTADNQMKLGLENLQRIL